MTQSQNNTQRESAPTRLVTGMPWLSATVATVLLAVAGVSISGLGWSAEKPHVIPVPAVDEEAAAPASETAVLAGGCFWGVQGVFQHVTGVTNAVSGYAGGEEKTAHYNTVGMGGTSHA